MRKSWMILGLLAGALVFVTGGLANNGHGHGNSHHKFGPYDVVTDDHGSCGNAWAVDTEKRIYKITRNHDGSFTLALGYGADPATALRPAAHAARRA